MQNNNEKLSKISKDFKNGDITAEQVIARQNKIISDFKAKGFNIDVSNGNAQITHRVFDKLNRFGGSAWSNLLKAARKGDSAIKDQALIAALDLTNKAYKGEKILLAFQLGGAAAGAAGLSLPAVTGSAGSLRLLGLSYSI